MDMDGMVLGPVVSMVESSRGPKDLELFLAHAVAEPVNAHVHSFGTALLHGVVKDAFGGAVVSLERRWWLWMAKKFKGYS